MTRLNPATAGILAAATYLLLTLPILLHGSRDVSFFVVAGDYFVDAHALAAPIDIRPNSFGYDGQFFYRLAVAPFSFANPAAGIRFDVPVYRSQRFLYPLIAWAVSVARPSAAAAALFAVNIGAVGLLAGAAFALVRRLAFSDTTAWAIVAWPGLLVSLTHDTAEIVTVALLLSALAARAHRNLPLFGLLGAASMLTRETAAPVFAGLLLWDLFALRRGASMRLILADIAAVLPVLADHAIMPILWHQDASEGVLSHDFGWPLLGLGRALIEKITAVIDAMQAGNHGAGAVLNLAALVVLFAVLGRATRAAWQLRRGPETWLVAAWLPTVLLMAGLSEGDGAFVTPFEYCRVFSECWPLSCLVVAAGNPARSGPIVLALGMAALVVAYTYGAFGTFRL